MVDGTLIPTWNWFSQGKINFSGKHKRAGFNHQVICPLDGKLLAITDPLPGARHDAYAFKAHGLDQLLDVSTLADKGYVGLNLATPTKRRPGQRLSREQKENNRVLNRLRSVVERVIAQVKSWRVLHTGFRRPLSSYGQVFSVVRGLLFLVAGGTL
ncbi:transposase family protein [Rothia sp. P5766]|uniref:transposase family protein n=1 Tax=Rothia sp. P5766 TaxID=3402656 RepID=UPI003ADE29BA